MNVDISVNINSSCLGNCAFPKIIHSRKLNLDVLVNAQVVNKKSALRDFFYFRSWELFAKSLPEQIARQSLKEKKSVSPREQPFQLMRAFVEEPEISKLDRYGLYPIFKLSDKSHVWEMRTKDTRSFGWFSDTNKFVAVCGGGVDLFKDEHRKPIKRVYCKFENCARNVFQTHVSNSDVSHIVDIKLLLTDVVGE